jgi:Peptidase family M23
MVASAVLALIVAGTPMARAEGPARLTASLTATTDAQTLEGELPVCEPNLARFITPNPAGRGTARVDYGGRVTCNFSLAAYGFAYLIDRTSGTPNNGGIISYGNSFSFGQGSSGTSTGGRQFDGKTDPGGRQVEVGFYLRLTTLDGTPWGPCGELPLGVRYLSACEGVGTVTLTVRVGSGSFNTGLGPFASLPLPRGALGRGAYGRAHHDYPAIDLPVPTGTAVYAVKAGTVRNIGGSCGIGIHIDGLDGADYEYCHLSSRSVGPGAQVLAGDLVGQSGNTGRSSGPHLHVEIEAGGQLRCPQSMLLDIYDGSRTRHSHLLVLHPQRRLHR